MSIQKVSLMNHISFRGETAKETQSASKAPNEAKDGKKKLALALGGLAAAGIGAVLLMRSGKVPSEINIEEFKKIGRFDKGIANAKGKLFTGIINAPVKDGKVTLEYEKGVLKQATKFKTANLPDTKPFLLPSSKKVYSTGEDGVKTVETFLYNVNHKTFGGKEWGQIGTTTVADGKVTAERIHGLTGDKLQDVTVKQQDGSWFKTVQEIGEFETGNSYHILTKNAKTGDVIRDELKTIEPAATSHTDVPKDPEKLKKQRRIFNL